MDLGLKGRLSDVFFDQPLKTNMSDLAAFKDKLGKSQWPIKLIKRLEDIPGTLPYSKDITYPTNTWVKERSKVLSEMHFYGCIGQEGIIIYNTLSDTKHIPLMLELFHHVKFLVISPTPQTWFGQKVTQLTQDSSLSFGDSRVLLVQECLTPELCDLIKGKLRGVLYYVSDTRNYSSDMLTLFSNAMHCLFTKRIGGLGCVPFRPPYQNGSKLDLEDKMVTVFKACEELGFEFLREYELGKGTYTYLGGELYIQPWAKREGVEVTLWAVGGQTTYNLEDWFGKMSYHNMYRAHAFCNIPALNPRGLLTNPYDGCSDCILETSIINSYTLRYKHSMFDHVKKQLDQVTDGTLDKHLFNIKSLGQRVSYKHKDQLVTFEPQVSTYKK